MTIEEAIKRAEETAIGEDELCKRYDRASGYSRNHDETIRTTDAKRCEKIAQEHRQLAEWLKDYKRLLENSSEIPTGSDDCISRQAVEDAMYDATRAMDLNYGQIMDYIDNLPSVTPQEPRWIPVSERLPEDRELVLCSSKRGGVFEGRYFDDETDCQWYAFRNDEFVRNDVIDAWMPLPEPYREVEE
jgi:hypothetical protein